MKTDQVAVRLLLASSTVQNITLMHNSCLSDVCIYHNGRRIIQQGPAGHSRIVSALVSEYHGKQMVLEIHFNRLKYSNRTHKIFY